MKNELPFDDRAQEVSWVLINRSNVAQNRPARYPAEASPDSTQQSPRTGSHEKKSELAASPPVLGKTHRPRLMSRRSELDIEYTRTNLG